METYGSMRYGKAAGIHREFAMKKNFVPDNSISTIKKDVKSVNPSGNFKNCTACSVTFDLRRRGYNVVANAFLTGIQEDDILQYYENGKWDQEQGIFSAHSPEDAYQKLSSNLTKHGEGSRGLFSARYQKKKPSDPSSGHCIAWEIVNGKTIFLDCQIGKIHSEKSMIKFLSHCDLSTILTERLDNLNPKTSEDRINI